MAVETYQNTGITTLSSGINNSTTSVGVTDGSVFPSTGNFRIRIDNEIMLCTARSSNTLTVTRAQESTSAASHSSGARVASILTAGAVNALRAEDIIKGTVLGRLTPSTGSPLGTGTDISSFFFTPYLGNQIGLYDGSSKWRLHTFSEVTISVPSTQFRMADVFIYDNSGTITGETVNWSQTSGSITGGTNASPIVITSNGHGLSNGDLVGIAGMGGNTAANGYIWQVANQATNTFELRNSTGNGTYTSGGTWFKINGVSSSNLTFQDGILVRSGATNKRYVGVIMTHGTSGQTSRDTTRVLMCNEYNREITRMSLPKESLHTYASSTWRPFAGDGTFQGWMIVSSTANSPVFSNGSVMRTSGGAAVMVTSLGLNRNNDFNITFTRSELADFVTSASVSAVNRSAGPHVIFPIHQTQSGTGQYLNMFIEGLIPC